MIVNVPYVDPTRRGEGEKADGVAWTPSGSVDFAGVVAGDLVYRYAAQVFAAGGSWDDGSTPVLSVSRSMEAWRIRDALRAVPGEFLAVLAALQRAAAEELGGAYAPDPPFPWLYEPMEGPPSPASVAPQPES